MTDETDKTLPLRSSTHELAIEQVEEKMHEIKKAVGEEIGEDLGVSEINTIGVLVLDKKSLNAVKVAFSFVLGHHMKVVIFSRSSKKLEQKVVSYAEKMGLDFEVKPADQIEGVDILIVSSFKGLQKLKIPVLKVI